MSVRGYAPGCKMGNIRPKKIFLIDEILDEILEKSPIMSSELFMHESVFAVEMSGFG